jgi:hypothetical protein
MARQQACVTRTPRNDDWLPSGSRSALRHSLWVCDAETRRAQASLQAMAAPLGGCVTALPLRFQFEVDTSGGPRDVPVHGHAFRALAHIPCEPTPN